MFPGLLTRPYTPDKVSVSYCIEIDLKTRFWTVIILVIIFITVIILVFTHSDEPTVQSNTIPRCRRTCKMSRTTFRSTEINIYEDVIIL